MVYFVKCSIESVRYRIDHRLINNPVNLALCTQIAKGKYAHYPDNEGLPTIEFKGCEAQWAFPTEEARDMELDRIASIQAV
jgi:hypothetical protein